jgi:hypothetical protein
MASSFERIEVAASAVLVIENEKTFEEVVRRTDLSEDVLILLGAGFLGEAEEGATGRLRLLRAAQAMSHVLARAPWLYAAPFLKHGRLRESGPSLSPISPDVPARRQRRQPPESCRTGSGQFARMGSCPPPSTNPESGPALANQRSVEWRREQRHRARQPR